MKKIISIFLFLILLLSSCVLENSEISVIDYKILDYQSKVFLGDDFNEDSLFVELYFSDDTKKVYCSSDIEFDYSDFDNQSIGDTTINITIKETQTKFKLTVSIIEKVFKLLMIGNSFSDDTIQWVHEICDDLGIDFIIANLYIGGCTLSTHLNNLRYNRSAYEFVTYNKTTKRWSRKPNTSIYEALDFEDWNYISLQQGSSQSGLINTYNDIDTIIDEILGYKENVKFIWNMTWAYQQNSGHSSFGSYNNNQMTMYKAIINSVKEKVLSNDRIELIVPNATSIQNARTSSIGDNLCRDVYCHLTYDLGRYIAGLTLVSALTKVDISNINYTPMNLSNSYKNIAIESVLNAINNPFEITQSKYTSEESIDLSNYIEIDYQGVGCAYHISTDPNNYNKLVTSANNSMNFIASKVFTKEELPVGSIIEIKTGYQYRPEGWINDSVQSTRPENVSVKYVKITEEWWGNYIKRAFNISKLSGQTLMYDLKESMEAFSIYVPKESYVLKEIMNEYAKNDNILFDNNGLNINNYRLYDYTYSNGFYNAGLYSTQQIEYIGDFANKFICTQTFTKDDLPVGTVIIVDSGYQYRPDAWIGNSITNPRPTNISTNFVKITEEWWGNYTIKGLNISKIDGSNINQQALETVKHVRIYIPN